MFPAFLFNDAEILGFFLVLLRVIAFVVTWPVFSAFDVPTPTKILFAVTIAFVLYPVVEKNLVLNLEMSGMIAALAAKEVFVGICLGFFCRLLFFGISVGGNLISTSIGMANAQLFNPMMGGQSTTVEQFYMAVATLIFLNFNGHHIFLTGLAESFHHIPLSPISGPVGPNFAVFKDGGAFMQGVLTSGIKIAAPVMIAVFIMNVSMGIIGRAVPQINVLATSLPVNVMAGLLVMILAAPAFAPELERATQEVAERLFMFMRGF